MWVFRLAGANSSSAQPECGIIRRWTPMKLVPDSADAQRWSLELGLPFRAAVIGANGHNISLVFSDLTVQTVDPGYSPFAVSDGGPELKIPMP
jgi:hypothetical protein